MQGKAIFKLENHSTKHDSEVVQLPIHRQAMSGYRRYAVASVLATICKVVQELDACTQKEELLVTHVWRRRVTVDQTIPDERRLTSLVHADCEELFWCRVLIVLNEERFCCRE